MDDFQLISYINDCQSVTLPAGRVAMRHKSCTLVEHSGLAMCCIARLDRKECFQYN